MSISPIFNVANMSFKAIQENKILAKISELQYSAKIAYGDLWT